MAENTGESIPRNPLRIAGSTLFVLWAVSGYWKIAPMSITSALTAAALLAIGLRERRVVWDRSPADLGGVAWAIALLVSTVFALDPAASLPRLGKAAFPFLVGVGAGYASDERVGRRAVGAILLSCALASVFGLVQFVLRGASFASRARGPVGHYLTFAGQLAIGGSLALAVLLVVRDRRWRVAAGITAALVIATLLATFSRSSWLGLLAAAALLLALTRPLALIPLAVAVAAFVGFAPGNLRARLWSIFDLKNPWNSQREFMWQAGWRMFRDHPVTGVGLQDLHALYARYRSPAATEPAGHLHSVPVQVAASMGLVGLAALVALYTSLARTATRAWRAQRRTGGLAEAVTLAALAAILAFAVAGLFEWNLGDEEVLHPLYALIGLAWAARGWVADGGPHPPGTTEAR